MSELNDHIEESNRAQLNREGTGAKKDSVEPGADSENHHRIYLHATDPLFHFANTNGLFPDDYAHILESLEETGRREEAKSEDSEETLQPEKSRELKDGLPDEGVEPGMDGEILPASQDVQEAEGVPTDADTAEEEDPGSAFVQWLVKREKPRALGLANPKRKGKKEKAAKKKPPDKKGRAQKEDKKGAPLVDLDTGTTPVKSKKGNRRKEQGIQLSPDVISETLAEVLASQGHIHAAIEMYEKLGLIYPEKKSFFAVKIENLKNR